MSRITVVGLGPGPLVQLTKEAESALLAADKVFFRTCSHPAYEWLKGTGKHVVCFDKLYALPWKEGGEVYEFMVAREGWRCWFVRSKHSEFRRTRYAWT